MRVNPTCAFVDHPRHTLQNNFILQRPSSSSAHSQLYPFTLPSRRFCSRSRHGQPREHQLRFRSKCSPLRSSRSPPVAAPQIRNVLIRISASRVRGCHRLVCRPFGDRCAWCRHVENNYVFFVALPPLNFCDHGAGTSRETAQEHGLALQVVAGGGVGVDV